MLYQVGALDPIAFSDRAACPRRGDAARDLAAGPARDADQPDGGIANGVAAFENSSRRPVGDSGFSERRRSKAQRMFRQI